MKITGILHEDSILERIANGDQYAFEIIYKEHYKPLCYYAFKFFQDEEAAEDVVQKTMVKLWEQREKITEIKSLSSFLYRTVHNNCINELKHFQVRDKHSDGIRLELETIVNENFDEEYYSRINTLLTDAIDKLPPKKKEIFKLKYFEGLKHKDIAERLDISYRTVETHVVKGLQKLRELLDSESFLVDK